MLLWVREQKRDALITQGHKMRIYVPLGMTGTGYSVRRLKENPKWRGIFSKQCSRWTVKKRCYYSKDTVSLYNKLWSQTALRPPGDAAFSFYNG